MKRYTLTVTEEQLRVIRQATELYARLHIPQYDKLDELVSDQIGTGEKLAEFRECSRRMEILAGNERFRSRLRQWCGSRMWVTGTKDLRLAGLQEATA